MEVSYDKQYVRLFRSCPVDSRNFEPIFLFSDARTERQAIVIALLPITLLSSGRLQSQNPALSVMTYQGWISTHRIVLARNRRPGMGFACEWEE